MAVRIIYFGSDNLNRVAALKRFGYFVDECHSFAELHASLVGIHPTDAVAVAENDGTLQEDAISLIRAISSAPLILFRNGNHHHSRAEFDLVVSHEAAADEWLSDFAELIARSSQRNR